jgi:hypothetical protein
MVAMGLAPFCLRGQFRAGERAVVTASSGGVPAFLLHAEFLRCFPLVSQQDLHRDHSGGVVGDGLAVLDYHHDVFPGFLPDSESDKADNMQDEHIG